MPTNTPITPQMLTAAAEIVGNVGELHNAEIDSTLDNVSLYVRTKPEHEDEPVAAKLYRWNSKTESFCFIKNFKY